MSAPHVVLHGGFHKTATSHIQSVLSRNAKALARQGVVYVPHRDIRKEVTVPCQLRVYEQLGRDYRTKYTEAELAARTGAFFGGLARKEPRRVILSEENMAGHCGHCVKRGLLYVWREQMIAAFAAQIPWPVREVHLGVRNYADFFASAYVEYLRSLKSGPFTDPREMRRQVLAHMPDWAKALGSVRRAFPDARLIVWPYERFRQIDVAVLQNLCGEGVEAESLTPPGERNKRPTASGRAVHELVQMIHRDGVEAAVAQRVKIQKGYPRGHKHGGWDPWTVQERAHLTRIYARDLAAISADPDIEVLGEGAGAPSLSAWQPSEA